MLPATRYRTSPCWSYRRISEWIPFCSRVHVYSPTVVDGDGAVGDAVDAEVAGEVSEGELVEQARERGHLVSQG